ncbi:choline transporter [Fusarium sp. NRRL 52700]|nr:choline transporter [Fusarium sp. NRRL 52700]
MQQKTTVKGTGAVPPSRSGSIEIGAVESYAMDFSKDNGTSTDDAILRAQGHKAAMPRLFSIVSTMGLMFCIMNAWVGSLGTFGQNLRYGGPQVVIFAALAAAFVQWIVTLGLSELASAFPSAGGQYHFMYILAPEKYKRFSAFIIGWMSVLAWWFATCAGLSLVAVSSTGLAAFIHPSYTPKNWHIYLCYLGVASISVFPIFAFPKSVPKITTGSMYLSLGGFVAWFVVLLATKSRTNDASFVLASDQGSSGWNSGTAWILGITNAMYNYGGSDSPIHIAEEMHSPGRKLPIVMNSTMLIAVFTAVPMMVAAMFKITDVEAVMNSGFPAVELLYQATGNRNLTIVMAVWLIIVFASCMPPQFITAGRVTWAFARDKGTPFHEFFSHVDTKLEFPARATLLALVFISLYGLIYMASSTAFNSVITSAVLFLNITLAAPQGVLVLRGREKVLPGRPFKLGYVGYFCNIFSVLWVTVLVVLVCMPPSVPVTVASMNWTSPILVGLFLLIIAAWFAFGKQFEGPNIDWEMLNQANEQQSELHLGRKSHS